MSKLNEIIVSQLPIQSEVKPCTAYLLDNGDGTHDRYVSDEDGNLSKLEGGIKSIQAGTNINIDNTDPKNPIISSTFVEVDTLNTVALRGNISTIPIAIKDLNKASLNYISSPSIGADPNIYYGGMNQNATGGGNTSFSAEGLKLLTTGDYNSAFGSYSLQTLTTGRGNIAVGAAMTGNAGGNITGKHNLGFGVSALNNLIAGYRNLALGNGTLSYIQNGKDNVAVGHYAGLGIVNGTNNVFIGAGAGGTVRPGVDNSYKLCIHSQPFNTSTNFWDNAVGAYSDYKNGLISGDFSLREVNINGKFSQTPSQIPNATGDSLYTKNIVAKPDGTYGWEDKPNLALNNVGRWNTSVFNWSNGIIWDDSINLGIGTNPDINTLPSRVKILPNNQKYFNLPLSSLTTVKPTTINVGDFYTAYNRLWFKVNDNNFAPATNYDTEIKVLGFQYDFRGDAQFSAIQNFNNLHSNNPRFGKSAIVNTGNYYGRTIMIDTPSSIGVDDRMYEGWLYSIDKSSVSGVQYYIDATGQFFVRSLGSQYHSSTTWGKALLDSSDKSTTIGSQINYTNIKWAVDSTTKAALIAPRMTQAQRLAITLGTTQEGAIVYQTDGTKGYYLWNGTAWTTLGSNIATADLTSTATRIFTQGYSFTWDTVGNPYYLKGLADQTANLTQYGKVLRIDPTTKQVAMGDSLEVAVTIPDNMTVNAPAMNVNYTVNHVYPDPVPSLPQNLIDLKNFMATIANNQYIQLQDSELIIQKVDSLNRVTVNNGVVQFTATGVDTSQTDSTKASVNSSIVMPHDKNWVFIVTPDKCYHVNYTRGGKIGFARTPTTNGVQSPEIGTLTGDDNGYGWQGYGMTSDHAQQVRPTIVYTKVGEVLNITIAYSDGTIYSANTDALTFLGDYRFVMCMGNYNDNYQNPSFTNLKYYIAP